MNLGHVIPAWVAGYVGIPFVDRGRDRRGLDCWGLVRLVYAERFAVALSSHDLLYDTERELDGMRRILRHELGDGTPCSPPAWARTATPRLGDVVLARLGRRWHVGLLVAHGAMLHAIEGTGSVIERTDGPLWAPRIEGVYRHETEVLVLSRTTPLAGEVVTAHVRAGATILQVVVSAGLEPCPRYRVAIGGREVPYAMWGRVRPRAGRTVTIFAAVAGGQGGGKTALRIIATVAVIVGAYYLGPIAAGAAFGAGATATQISLSTALIGLAGSLAVNALIPPPKPRLSTEAGPSTSPTLTGARNELRPYQVVPRVLGQHRMTPPLAAVPFVEIAGDDQYLRMLFAAGYGPLELTDFKIGDTDLDQFDGVELEVRNGRDGEAPCSIYQRTVREDALSVLLTANDGWVQRTTPANVVEISVDVTWPQGLVTFERDGGRHDATVTVEVEFKAVADSTWRKVNGDATTSGSPTEYRGLDVLTRTPEALFDGGGVHEAAVAWSADGVSYPGAKPAYLPPTQYSWVVQGWIYLPHTGAYSFAIDGSDACDCHVDWREVASYYGGHGPAATSATLDTLTTSTGPVVLGIGWHQIRARVEHRTGGAGGGALALAWKRPGDSVYSIIPQSSFSRNAGPIATESLNYGAYTWATYGSSITATEQRTEQIRRNLAWAVPAGQYDVRLRRITADYDDTLVVDDVYWTALRAVQPEDPIKLDRQAKVALRIKATDQLQGVLDDFNFVARSIVPDYDAATGTWVERGTSNPASLYRALLQGAGNARPLADERLDLAELAAWHVECDERGLHCNAIIDFGGTLFERLADVAAAGRASFGMRDGRFSVVRDRVQTVAVQHITPKNSSGFSGRKSFADIPHALRVRFLNAAEGYQQDERVVPNDGYQVDGFDSFGAYRPDLPAASIFEPLELFGTTSAEEAWKHARYAFAVAQLRPEVFTLQTDFEHLVCTRGDLVLVSHDVAMWGQISGRIVGLVTNAAGELTGLRLDEAVAMATGPSYCLRVRRETGDTFLRTVTTVAGESTEVTLESPVAPTDPMPAVGDLWMFGELGRETRPLLIKAIEVDRDLRATLTLIDHAPAVHEADQGEIPPFDSGITQDPDIDRRPDAPVIETIRSDDYVMVRDADGSLRQRMVIALRRASGTAPVPTHAQVRTRQAGSSGNWTHHPVTPIEGGSVSVFDVVEGITYDIRLRVLAAEGLASDWTSATHLVVGKSQPPPDVEAFDCVRLADGSRRFSWSLGAIPPDVAGVLLRYGPEGLTWEQMSPLVDRILDASPYETADPPAGTWRFAIKMIDTSGNESVDALFITRTLGEPPLDGVVASQDEGALVWPGTKTSCHVAGTALEADDPTTWSQLAASGAGTWATYLRWNLSPRSPIVYESTALDAGFELDFSPDALVETEGDALVELAWSSDDITYSSWTEWSQARQLSVTGRYVKARVTVDQNAMVPVAVIDRLVLLIRAESRTHEIQDLDTSTLPAGSINAPGDVYLPVPAGFFRAIRSVQLGFNLTGYGYTWELVERNAVTGPRVRIYDASGTKAHALIDAVIRGV